MAQGVGRPGADLRGHIGGQAAIATRLRQGSQILARGVKILIATLGQGGEHDGFGLRSAIGGGIVAHPQVQIGRVHQRHGFAERLEIAQRPRPHAVGEAEEGQHGTQPAALDTAAAQQKPQQRHESERQQRGAQEGQSRQRQAVQQTGEGAAGLAGAGAEVESGGQREGRQGAVIQRRGVDDPVRMEAAQQSRQGGNRPRVEGQAGEQEIQPRRQRPQDALNPAGHGGVVRRSDHAAQPRQQPGVAWRHRGRALLRGGQRRQAAEPAVFAEVVDESVLLGRRGRAVQECVRRQTRQSG